MTARDVRPQPGAWVLVALAVLFVAWLTLLPSSQPSATEAWSCVICGERGAADAIVNVVLFAPFGTALALLGIRARRAILAGALFSAAIELVQIWIPGRDSNIGDVLSNTLGTAVGVVLAATAAYWIAPARHRSRSLAGAWTAVAALTAWAPALLLQPSLPHSTYYGQWTHDLGYLEWYRGRVLEARVGSLSVPDGPYADSRALRAELAAKAPIVVQATAGPRIDRLGPLFSIYDERRREILLIGPDRDDLVYRFRTRATALRLDSPDLRARGLMRGILPGESLLVAVTGEGNATCLAVNERRDCGLAFHPGRGWSLLEYQGHLPPWLIKLLDGGWLIFLALPIGYWSERRGTLLLLSGVLVAAAVSAAVYGRVPAGSSASWTITGLALGAVTRRVIARHLTRAPGVSAATMGPTASSTRE